MNERAKNHASGERGLFFSRYGRKIAALLFWVALIALYNLYALRNGLTPLGTARSLAQAMGEGPVGAALFVAVYTMRPIILFPASLLTIVAGLVFGPVIGGVLSIIGSNASATVAYFIGRYFGGEVVEDKEKGEGFVARYSVRLRRNAFEAVFVMRLVYLPYDLVNYAAGLLRVGWTPFILATALGSVPGTLSFVLLGSSLGPDALSGDPEFEPLVLVASVVLFVVSFALSRYLKRRERRRGFQQTGEAEDKPGCNSLIPPKSRAERDHTERTT